jgi:hypothetical protein
VGAVLLVHPGNVGYKRSALLPLATRRINLREHLLSSGADYVTLEKYFSHPSLVIYFFATPPIKVKLGHQIGGGLLIANHLRPQRINVEKC